MRPNQATRSRVLPCRGCAARDTYPTRWTIAHTTSRLMRCSRCGLVFSEAEVDVFDSPRYEYYGQRVDWPEERLYDPITESRYSELLGRLEDMVGGRRLLDVGCGAAHLVRVAMDRGWTALGIDLSPSAIELARRWGINVEVADFMSQEVSPDYDVITMIEVVEHLSQPAHFLKRAEEVLKPGGLLYLTTPNFESLSRRALGERWRVINPEHLSYFSTRSLAALVQRHTSLEIVMAVTRNTSIAALRELVHRRSSIAETESNDDWSGSPSADPDYSLRSSIERSRLLQIAKRATNAVLRFTHSGDTLEAILRKPRPPQP
jgi:2-polyprenyl-3-methyl-5-hydroxy-6-metoxy-1,4-benzoquinol methylase